MIKRTNILAAAVLLTVLLLGSGYSSGGFPAVLTDTEAGQTDTEGEIILKFPLVVSGELPATLDQVEDAMSSYAMEQIGVGVELVPVEMDQLEDYYYLQLSAADPVDFISILPAGPEISEMVSFNMLFPLDQLLQNYGTGILAAAEDVLQVGRLNQIQYMIPQLRESYTMGTSLEFNANLLRRYDMDVSEIRSIEDLEAYLEVIHQKEPNVIPLGVTDMLKLLGGYDPLGDTLGVLNLAADDSLTVVDWYETEEFADLAALIHDWYDKGYINPDALVQQESETSLLVRGKEFCAVATYMPTGDWGAELTEDSVIVEIPLKDQPQLLTSYQAGLMMVGIFRKSENPEKAMEFLNLLYTDPYMVNLLKYGISGEDYTTDSEGRVVDRNDYYLLYGQAVNQTLEYRTSDQGEEYEDTIAAYIANDTVSPAFGFVFDQQPVMDEVERCSRVVDEYYPLISTGCVDPETELPKFIQALKDAGIDSIIEEKQRQLDRWKEN